MKLWQLAMLQIAVCSVLTGIGYGPAVSCTMLGVVWLSGYKLER